MRSHGASSHRGPASVVILWIFELFLSILWMRTNENNEKGTISMILFSLHIAYAATLILSGRASYFVHRNASDNEVKLCH